MPRRRRPRGPTFLRCPQCGSDRILPDAAMITGQRYHCLACDYVGSLVLEQDAETLPQEDDE